MNFFWSFFHHFWTRSKKSSSFLSHCFRWVCQNCIIFFQMISLGRLSFSLAKAYTFYHSRTWGEKILSLSCTFFDDVVVTALYVSCGTVREEYFWKATIFLIFLGNWAKKFRLFVVILSTVFLRLHTTCPWELLRKKCLVKNVLCFFCFSDIQQK